MQTADPCTVALGRDLINRLLTVLEDRMTKAGHPYALVTQEHRGTCPPYECSMRCQEYKALFVEAVDYLEATAEPEVVQPELFAEVAG